MMAGMMGIQNESMFGGYSSDLSERELEEIRKVGAEI